MSDTRTSTIHLINHNNGAESKAGHWAMRDAAVLVVSDLDGFLRDHEPRLACAGLYVQVLSDGKWHLDLPTVRQRIHPLLRGLLFVLTCGSVRDVWRNIETMPSAYPRDDILATLYGRWHWDRDKPEQQRYWESVAAGHLVRVWDPFWGRNTRLMRTLVRCGMQPFDY